jgi:hypothetical protein
VRYPASAVARQICFHQIFPAMGLYFPVLKGSKLLHRPRTITPLHYTTTCCGSVLDNGLMNNAREGVPAGSKRDNPAEN